MGVTYKAFDIDLRCPVTLKVISEKYLGDESARLRFLREARAAAKIRHPNVASVFHLGRTGDNYFYAMEFVEGETLENLVRRSGPLEVKCALENCDAGRRRFGCSAQARPCSSRYQTKQHHGERRRGKWCSC
jgi:serine/threonine protein kinase